MLPNQESYCGNPVATTEKPFATSECSRSLAWVCLPLPSIPSIAMSNPRVVILGCTVGGGPLVSASVTGERMVCNERSDVVTRSGRWLVVAACYDFKVEARNMAQNA